MVFRDRRDAGRQLADRVEQLGLERPVVLALPRGGVPVADEVARRLGAPLDVLVVRKIGAPGNPEYGIGAIGEGGVRVLDQQVVQRLGIPADLIERTVSREAEELARRLERYRGGRPPVPLEGCSVVVVDDGLATGVTATAAARVLRRRGVERLVLAVPVGAPDSLMRVQQEVDDLVSVLAPPGFMAVGTWYDDFAQTSDEEVVSILSSARARGT